jgi:hypothetical protein
MNYSYSPQVQVLNSYSPLVVEVQMKIEMMEQVQVVELMPMEVVVEVELQPMPHHLLLH